jgi:hypothetical protein
MEEPEAILKPAVAIVSESMGKDAGEDFYNLYKYEDKEGIIEGVVALLQTLVGPEMMDKKIAAIRKEK